MAWSGGGWKRVNGPTWGVVIACLVGAGFLGVFVWAMGSIATGVLEIIPRIRARPVAAPSGRAEGPAVVHGRVAGPTRETPLGTRAVAYYTVVEREYKSGKNTNHEIVCDVFDLGGLRLTDGESEIELDYAGARFYWNEPNNITEPRMDQVYLLADPTRGAVPGGLAARPECPMNRPGTYRVHEYAWFEGQEVAASGCIDKGRLRPCGDGADFFASSCGPGGCKDAPAGKAAVIRHWSERMNVLTIAVLALVGAYLTVLGIVSLVSMRKLRRQRRAVAHAGAQ